MLFYGQQSMADRQHWASYSEARAKAVPETESMDVIIAESTPKNNNSNSAADSQKQPKDLKRKLETKESDSKLEPRPEKTKKLKTSEKTSGMSSFLFLDVLIVRNGCESYYQRIWRA